MKIAVYPGSFDPLTLGHLDIIERASALVDELVVGVLNNSAKSPLFSLDERVNMIVEAVSHLPNVRVEAFSGLSVDFVRKCKARFIVRGLRAVTDFEYELQMAQTNRSMDHEVDTIFFTTALNYAYISSTIVKEVAWYGGNISGFVTPKVEKLLKEKISEAKLAPGK